MKSLIAPLTAALVCAACTHASHDSNLSTTNNEACIGVKGGAPQGALQATRIHAADSSVPSLYEGPVWTGGRLYFSHFRFSDGFPANILAYDGSELTIALEDSGSNGLARDHAGNILAGTHKYKSVSRYQLNDWQRTNVASSFKGEVFNSPNDLTQASDGTVYFTDPDFQRAAAPGGQPVTGVYRVRDGEVVLVDDSIQNPNGISLSPDEQFLYVAGGGENGFVRRYDLRGELPVEAGNLLDEVEVPDGMAVDCLGNVYVTEHTAQRIRVVNPAGDVIATIALDANVTNAAFGGDEGKTLFITGAGSLWQVDLPVKGLPY
ncbi:SMP-30/gluconolactonase/LRE family protein [Gilvimarinus chinensis]|uniref:SMP-30/gluconolactonase/LRE family protein n=1 Tax=Gilvimarinus chinensis TaxID=396005 RepID=UPI00036CA5FE|nr:SMP-30/gluconolactonase/LRE family protein [Gilvimarinus chinensis]